MPKQSLNRVFLPVMGLLVAALAGACQKQVPPATSTPTSVSPSSTPPAALITTTTESTLYLPQIDHQSPPTATVTLTATTPMSVSVAMTSTPEATATPEPMKLKSWPAMTLADWPRPANDNGLCIHNSASAYLSEAEIDLQISRLQAMHMRWTVVHYGDERELMKAAPRYRDAGIMVIWRKNVRAYQPYYDWGRDVQLLLDLGVPPYMQLYNEPSLPAEWDDRPIDQSLFLKNLLSGIEQVYNAGGYVGLQFVNDEWLRAALREVKARGGEAVFSRMFLVPHPYGLNHPPDYTADANGVLGFLPQAQVAQEEIGFVPPMIAGEGGWKWNASDDRNFPPIDAERHRDYHLAVFNWFRTGVLSNGQPLPDTLFAFCPWLLSDPLDDSAWFDSFAGERTLTVEAVKAIPEFVRGR